MVLPGEGGLRTHWHNCASLLDQMGRTELQRRWQQAQRLIHDNGVTYNVYGDPAGMDRPWHLDPIPCVLGAVEWQWLEAGLIQRARLLDLIIADIYGPQRILREQWLPPQLIFANPGFLRPCHGIRVVGGEGGGVGRWLHHYAADLGRSSDGSFWVLGDRTQSPSGAGYALENRIVISRAVPDVFRDCRVRRLARFFSSTLESHRALAPHNKENPRIVLLTPGPYNETYFEHAYLARYLGYTLVEGADLTVRDNTVYLKTLGGLQQVDVIVRRQDDCYCDPLELKPDSSLGIPGLVQALHA
ncbi:MAG: circularly permuted type 2 ATP-grasp protein, partial [Phycisphaerae bacterium]